MRRARLAAMLAVGMMGAGPAEAARYYEFQVTGAALRPGVYSVLSSYPGPQILGVYTLSYTSTDTFAFDTASMPALPDTSQPGWNGNPYPHYLSSPGSTSYQPYAYAANYNILLEGYSLASPAYVDTLNFPGGPDLSFTFSFADVAAGDIMQPLNVTGGSFTYHPIVDGRGPYVAPTDPGQIISVLARTTDVAPASLRATERLVVSVMPEPATWATMIFGFGLAGAVLRRQRRRTVPVALPA